MLEGKFPCQITSLILNEIRHKVWTQSDVGSSIAPLLVVVGGREYGQDLGRQPDMRCAVLKSIIVSLFLAGDV